MEKKKIDITKLDRKTLQKLLSDTISTYNAEKMYRLLINRYDHDMTPEEFVKCVRGVEKDVSCGYDSIKSEKNR